MQCAAGLTVREKWRSKTHANGGRTPSWNDKHTFNVVEGDDRLNVQVYDEDSGKDDLIGSVCIDLNSVYQRGTRDEFFPLTTTTGKPAGEVRVVLQFQGSSGAPPPGAPPPGYGAPPPGYGAPPPGYGGPPPGYGGPPGAPPPGYGAPPGAPPPGYVSPPASFGDPLNDAGVPMNLGQSVAGYDGSRTFYCGRKLGDRVIPGSDGQCGPTSGPQCPDCRDAQKRMGSAASPLPTPPGYGAPPAGYGAA